MRSQLAFVKIFIFSNKMNLIFRFKSQFCFVAKFKIPTTEYAPWRLASI